MNQGEQRDTLTCRRLVLFKEIATWSGYSAFKKIFIFYAKYRANTSTPTQKEHKRASVYHNLGGGGVDFPAVFKVLRDRHYKGWAIFDVDGPRKGDDGFDSIGGNMDLAVDDYTAHNINYPRDVLGVRLPPPG